jgi:alpha-glucosidase
VYTRWIQFGIHSPVVRTHTTKNAKAERRVWAYPEPYSTIMADALRQRYEMIPYIYTEARAAFDTGLSLCRPMYYDWPEREEAYKAKDQYLFGRELLVAPVLKPVNPETEHAAVDVWLPSGQWFDTARGCFEKGGRRIRRGYLISETPVFVRAGAILPGQGSTTRVSPGSYRNLVVTAYPGGDGAYRLYEDDGESLGYRTDEHAWIPLAQRAGKRTRQVAVGPVEGRYSGFERTRSLEVRLPAAVPPTGVSVGSKTLKWSYRLGREGWTYDGDTATVIIRVAKIDLRRKTVIDVRQDATVPASLALGLKGLMARIARVSYYARQATSALILDSEERLGADLEQVGNRVSRNPASLAQERRRLNRSLPALAAMLPRLGLRLPRQQRHDHRLEEPHRIRLQLRLQRTDQRLLILLPRQKPIQPCQRLDAPPIRPLRPPHRITRNTCLKHDTSSYPSTKINNQRARPPRFNRSPSG